ncbi:hypothetical protein ACOMHN_004617 [Nucella lapillus]
MCFRKLVKSFQPKKKEEDELQFTWAGSFADMVREVHDMAGQHEVIAESLQTALSRDLQAALAEFKQERKKHKMGQCSVVSVGSRHKIGHGSVISVGSRHKMGQGSLWSVLAQDTRWVNAL